MVVGMSRTAVAYVRDYLESVGVQVGERENSSQVAKKLAAFIGCNPPTQLDEANRLIEAWATGKRGETAKNKKAKPWDWWTPLNRKPYEYKTTRHIPSLVADVRVWWKP
jgi:hypothetical protein